MAEKMRLVCPSCAAQYEVDAAVIPVGGRDVQCSNCGHTWWQRRAGAASGPDEDREEGAEEGPGTAPEAAPAAPEAETPEVPEAGAPEVPPVTDAAAAAGGLAEIRARFGAESGLAAPAAATGTAAPAAAAAQTAAASRPGSEDDWSEEEEDRAAPSPDLAARRKSLDEAVLDVLRAEAERESQARQGQDAASPDPAAAALVATLGRGEDEREAAVRARMDAIDGTERPGGRGNQRLPDVEEINSTLEGRVVAEAAAPQADPAVAGYHARRTGFRIGFTLMLSLALAVLVLYTFAERIVARAPGMEPGMSSFVQTVDAGRAWLNGAAASATEVIRGVTTE